MAEQNTAEVKVVTLDSLKKFKEKLDAFLRENYAPIDLDINDAEVPSTDVTDLFKDDTGTLEDIQNKIVLVSSEAEYLALENKVVGTLYCIPEED